MNGNIFKTPTYYVWRRSDGYVDASNGSPPQDWQPANGGPRVTFEILATYDNWPDAHDHIAKERGLI